MKLQYVIEFLLISLLLAPLHSLADTRATLFLEGYIPIQCDLRIDPVLGRTSALNISLGETGLKLADVAEISNNPNGYEVLIESVNAGLLLHSNGTSGANYQVQYGATGTMTTPPAVGSPLSVKNSGVLTGLSFAIEELFIDVTPLPTGPGGAYTDTLILTMQAL